MRERLRFSSELRILYGWMKTSHGHATDPAQASLIKSAMDLVADAGKLAVAAELDAGAAPKSAYVPAEEVQDDASLIEWCCGTATLSKVARERGWDALALDVQRTWKRRPDVIASILASPIRSSESPDLLWMAVPCTEYSLARHPKILNPDRSIWEAALSEVGRLNPRLWAIENVRGAIRIWGRPSWRSGHRYVWGKIPPPLVSPEPPKPTCAAPVLRAKYSEPWCHGVLQAVEAWLVQ